MINIPNEYDPYNRKLLTKTGVIVSANYFKIHAKFISWHSHIHISRRKHSLRNEICPSDLHQKMILWKLWDKSTSLITFLEMQLYWKRIGYKMGIVLPQVGFLHSITKGETCTFLNDQWIYCIIAKCLGLVWKNCFPEKNIFERSCCIRDCVMSRSFDSKIKLV